MQIEKNAARKHYRIELPARISIGDKVYNVQDWSLGGFLVTCSPDEFIKDWQGDVKLILPFEGVDVSCDLKAKVAWIKEGKAGFTFLEVNPRVRNILKSYVEASIEGRLGEAEGIIARLDGVEIPLEVEKPFTESEEKEFKRAFYWRSTLYWSFGIVLLLFFAIAVFYSMTRSNSLHAIVTAPLVNIDIPFEGKLSKIAVKEGEIVKKGQLLASMEDQGLIRSVEKQRQTLVVAERELDEARVRLGDEEKALSLYRAAATRTLAELEAELDASKARLLLASKELKRTTMLLSANAISHSLHDEAQKTFDEEESLVRSLNERIKLARINEQSASRGRYLSNNGEVRGEARIIASQIATREARIKEEEAKLHELLGRLEKTRLVSPCDAEVYVIKQPPGSSMHQGDSFILLRPTKTEERPWVLARFTFDEAQSISMGSEVEVFLPALGKRLTGHVLAIGHQVLSGPRTITPDMEISFSEVPVKIRLDEHELPLQIGMAAVVNVRVPFRIRLETKFGRLF